MESHVFMDAICSRPRDLSVGTSPPFPMKGHRFTVARVPSRNPLSTWPGLMVYGERLDKPGLPGFGFFDPVVSPAGAFYPDAWTAAASWSELRGFNGGNDSRAFGTVLFVPDARARFASFELSRDEIRIAIDVRASDTRGWKLVCGYHAGDWRNLVFDLAPGVANVRVDPAASSFQAAITTATGEVVDFFRPDQHGESGHVLHVVETPPSDFSETVSDRIANGEGETTEFKGFVHPGDPKMDELARTVVAFSNTSGGLIIVGVQDDGELVDLARSSGMRKWAAEPITDEVVDRYARTLRQRVIDTCSSPTPVVRAIAVQVRDAWLAVLAIEPGPAPPYSFRDGQVFVRRSATSRLAHPEREPEMFSGRRAGEMRGP